MDLAKKIRSKFLEPRGVLKKAEDGAEIVLESGKKMVGSTPAEAAEAYGALYGSPDVQEKITAKVAEAGKKRYQQGVDDYLAKKTTKAETDTVTAAIPEKNFLEKASEINSALKRKAMQAVAQKLGRKGNALDSEGSAQDIVEAVASKLGVPENSMLGNAAKAAGVAALEMAPGDLTDLVPVSKLSKLVGAAKKSTAISSALAKLKKAKEAGEVVGRQTGTDVNTFNKLKRALDSMALKNSK